MMIIIFRKKQTEGKSSSGHFSHTISLRVIHHSGTYRWDRSKRSILTDWLRCPPGTNSQGNDDTVEKGWGQYFDEVKDKKSPGDSQLVRMEKKDSNNRGNSRSVLHSRRVREEKEESMQWKPVLGEASYRFGPPFPFGGTIISVLFQSLSWFMMLMMMCQWITFLSSLQGHQQSTTNQRCSSLSLSSSAWILMPSKDGQMYWWFG